MQQSKTGNVFFERSARQRGGFLPLEAASADFFHRTFEDVPLCLMHSTRKACVSWLMLIEMSNIQFVPFISQTTFHAIRLLLSPTLWAILVQICISRALPVAPWACPLVKRWLPWFSWAKIVFKFQASQEVFKEKRQLEGFCRHGNAVRKMPGVG